jgi:hypothetical protein
MLRQGEQRGTFHVVQMVEHACLMGAQLDLGLLVANVTAVAGEVDLRIAP